MASIKRNGFYNDPAIGQAFSNLASMFAPPKATELYAYAKAASERAQAQRLADYYRVATDPNMSREMIERYGLGAGQINPSQGYYALDQADATKRYGYDTTNATTLKQTEIQQSGAWDRNKYDVDARSGDVRFKTGADNTAAGERNAADNTRALQQTQLEQMGQTDRTMLSPIPQGAVRQVPPRLAGLYGVPETQNGNVNVAQGARSYTADGRTLDGPEKPLNESELTARIMAGAPPLVQQAWANRGVPVEKIVNGQGVPTFASRNDAIGQPAYVAPAAGAARKDAIAVIGDRQVPVTRGPSDLDWKMPDGSPIPPEARIVGLPRPTGTGAEVGLPTMANKTQANSILAVADKLESQVGAAEQLLKDNPGIAGLPGSVRGAAQDIASIAREFTQAFGQDAKRVIAPEEINALADRLSPTRDPNIRRFNGLMLDIAYSRAQLNNPTGEVSQQALLRSIESLGANGWLSSNDTTLEGLKSVRDLVTSTRRQAGTLQAPGTPPAAPPADPAARVPAARYTRDANGKIVRVP